jgi:hypothetical protein
VLPAPPIVASKRLPASRADPVSIGWPLYQSLAVPEACPAPEQVRRAEILSRSASPGASAEGVMLKGNAFRIALLKPELPEPTLLICPSPTFVVFINTSARRSSLSPTSSLFFSPTQTFAGPSAVSILGTGVFVGVTVGVVVDVLVGVCVAVRVTVLVTVLVRVAVGVGVFVKVFVRVTVTVTVRVAVLVNVRVGVEVCVVVIVEVGVVVIVGVGVVVVVGFGVSVGGGPVGVKVGVNGGFVGAGVTAARLNFVAKASAPPPGPGWNTPGVVGKLLEFVPPVT